MPTKNIVPRGNNEGKLGTDEKRWNSVIAETASFTTFSGSITGNEFTLFSGSAQSTASFGFLQGDGRGLTNLTATATPAGSNTFVQFNDGGVTGGDAGFTYDKSTNSITAITHITSSGDISSSATSTGSFGLILGDGSQLTNLPASFTSAGISGSFTPTSSSLASRVSNIVDGTTIVASASNAITASHALNSGVTSYTSLTNVPTDIVSGSAQLATSISGSFTSTSSSLASRLTTAESELSNTLISGSAQIASYISGSFNKGFEFEGTISGSSTSTGSFGHLLIRGEKTSGTNTGDISLAGGSKDYVTLSNQELTINQVDLTDDVTGVLPSANLDADTAHLSGTQTFSGAKTFSSALTTAAINSSGDITTTGNITAQNFIISSSVTNLQIATLSGSTEFGDNITDTHLFTGSLFISGNLDAVNLTADSSSFSTRTTTLEAASSSFSSRITTAELELSNTLISGSAQIATYVSGAFTDTSSSLATRTTNLETDSGSFSTRLTTEEGNVDTLQARRVIAGDGLIGGGDLTADRTFAVGAGTGVTVNSGDIAIGQDIGTTSKPLFAAVSSSGDISGSSTSTGSFGAGFINNKLGIGTTSPARKLEIKDTSSNVGIRLTTGTALDAIIDLGDTGDADIGQIRYDNNTDKMHFRTNASDRLTIDSSGNINALTGNISGSATSTGSFGAVVTPTYGRTISNITEIIKVTVVDDGGDHFAFEGATTPNLVVSEGKTYRFDQSDSSNDGHPFRFSLTENGSTYTTGVTTNGTPGTTGAYTELQVNKTTANRLFYKCNVHSGMGNQGNILKNDLSNFGGNISGSASSTGSFGYLNASGNLNIDGGYVSVHNQGVESQIRLYCEVNNAHYVALQAPAHADFGGNVTVTLPATTTTLIGTNTTDTLTNKTLTSPDINGGTIDDVTRVSGSATSTGSFGHVMVGGNNFTTAVSESAAASGFGTGGGAGGGDMNDLVDDTSPQLGGDLDLNSNDITGTGNITINGNISGSSTSTGSFERVHITDRLGIGTTTPFNDLHILTAADNIAKFKSSDATARIILEDNNSVNNGNYIQVTNDVMTLATNGGNAGLIIDDSQNIQIGGAISGSSTSTGSFGKLETAGASNIGGTLSIPGFPNVSSSLAAAVAGGDNLGNHTATQDINLDGNNLINVSSLTATGNISSSLTSTGSFGSLMIGGGHFTSASLASGGSGGVSDIVDDTSPQLGGDLDLNSNDITGTGNVNIIGDISGSLTSTGSFGNLRVADLSQPDIKIISSSISTRVTTLENPETVVADFGGVTFSKESAGTTWNVTHNLNSQYPNVTVYDGDDEVIIPSSIVANTISSSTITFDSPVSGKAHFSVGGNLSGSAQSSGSFGVYSNDFIPSIDNTHDLGSSTHRWANAHIGDIELSNEGTEGNEVDGTTGSWTIQEGEDDLYLLNRKNGKKYKFKLEEIK